MKKRFLLIAIFCYLFMQNNLTAQVNELQRTTPEEQGVPSSAVIALFDSLMALPQTEIHSVIVLRHGKVIGEIYPAPFAPIYRHTMYSCSKTFVGAAVGLAIHDNLLRLTDRVGSFFPEMFPDSSIENLASITVRDLLTMSSGITPNWDMRNTCSDWIRTFLHKPVKTPGVKFEYDSINSYLLSAIVQKVTGVTLLEYLQKKLFTPMNITDVAWELSPEGFNTGGWGLHIQSESLAKFGLLLLNHGVWEGRQLLPASWVNEMTSKQMEAGNEDYGYHMWLCEYPGAVCADGALGQYILIIPEKDMVVVITECTLINGSRQRSFVWNNLLPVVKEGSIVKDKGYKKLVNKQKQYTLPLVQGKRKSSKFHEYEKKIIKLSPNKYGWETIRLEYIDQMIKLHIQERNGHSFILPFGYKQWSTGVLDTNPPYSIQPVGCFKGLNGLYYVAGSYAWSQAHVLRLKAHYVNWVSSLDLTIRFDNQNVNIEVKENYSSEKQSFLGELVESHR